MGREPLGYLWYVDGELLPGHTNASIPIIAGVEDGEREFQVVVTNALGSVTSAVAQVTVNPWNVRGMDLYHVWQAPAELSHAVAVAAGGGHALALRTNGTVLAWGKNADGQATVPVEASPGPRAGTGRGPVSRRSPVFRSWSRDR